MLLMNLKVELFHSPIPVAARSKVCYRSLDGIAGSNLAVCIDVCLL